MKKFGPSKKKETISLVGLGKLGLPFIALLADRGFQTIGVDSDRKKIQALQKGTVPFFEPGLNEIIRRAKSRRIPLRNFKRQIPLPKHSKKA